MKAAMGKEPREAAANMAATEYRPVFLEGRRR
jgi:hypothetical protein